MMKEIIEQLIENKKLNKEEARKILLQISLGSVSLSHIVAFITVYLMRPITVEELEGFRDALMELCVPIDLSDYNTIDLCGTGGDSKNTFNISTLSSMVVAASGIKVAKHGNYGVSSLSGSSNIMEYFGYKFSISQDTLQRQLDKYGICFMHAPLFHPAMKSVGPIRKELGIKTFFNMLGPLVNPARPKYRITGVFNMELARLYTYLLHKNKEQFKIIYSLDGYDEISLTGKTKVFSSHKEEIVEPHHFQFKKINQADLFGGNTIDESGALFISVLDNTCTEAQKNVVLANSAMAIQCVYPDKTVEEAIAIAKEALESKKAYHLFKKLISEQ